jgi:alcohol dehydrogenase class IV
VGFVFRTAGEVRFGRGEALKAAAHAATWGRRPLLVTGAASLARSGHLAELRARLGAAPGGVEHVTVAQEPDVPLVDAVTATARRGGCDVVFGCGGGAVLDVAKAVAALVTNGGGARDYLEDVGSGRVLTRPTLPLALAATTAGTGAEVTRNAVLRVPDRAVKRSLRSDRLLPRLAVVDPDLVAGAPPRVAAAAGFDALTHLVEAAVSRAAQPLVDALAAAGIPAALAGLRALAEARATDDTTAGLALAALYGGMAVANAGLGAAHGLVAPLGGLLLVPHGVGCAALLPPVLLVNHETLTAQAPGSPALARFATVAALICAGLDEAGPPTVPRAAAALARLRRALGLPAIGELGIGAAQVAPILGECRGGSMKANPVRLDDAALGRILRGAVAE